MKELEIFNLYETSNDRINNEFEKKIETSLNIKLDYEKIFYNTYWIEIIEETIPYIDNILRNPNRFIVNEEELVKIELARRITVDSIKHLSRNTNLIQDYDIKTGDVKPSKILNINKEESYDTYENRVIYTLIQNMKYYISEMKNAIVELNSIKEKDEKQLEYEGKTKVFGEEISLTTQIKTQLNNEKNNTEELLERISNLEERIVDLSSTEVYKEIDKKHITLVHPPIRKTNLILKNVNFQYAMNLWDFLQEETTDNFKHIKDKKEYVEENELKKMMDETFLIQYLIIDSLEKDKLENEENQKKIAEQTINQMIQRVMSLDVTITENDLQEMVANKYEEIKYKSMATISEIQKIFKQHIDRYLDKIK